MTSLPRKRSHLAIAATIAMATASLGSAPAADADVAAAPRVGVVVQLSIDVEPEVADQLGSDLAEALAHELRVEALGGADVRRRLPTAGIADDCLAAAPCVADTATRLTATQLLFLVVVRNGEDFQIDTTAVDVATNRHDARPRIVVHGKADAPSAFRTAASRMLPDAAPREVAQVAPATTVPPPIPEAVHHFTTATWISSGIAAASLVTSGVIGITVRSDYNDCQHNP